MAAEGPQNCLILVGNLTRAVVSCNLLGSAAAPLWQLSSQILSFVQVSRFSWSSLKLFTVTPEGLCPQAPTAEQVTATLAASLSLVEGPCFPCTLLKGERRAVSPWVMC